MKKILSIFAIYGILSNVNAQGWSESFNIDATPTVNFTLTSDMTWAWWGWGTAEIDNGVLTMVGAADPFGNNTSWIQIDETIDLDAGIAPTAAEMYIKLKFTTTGTASSDDYFHILVATDPDFLSNFNMYSVYSRPYLGDVGGYYFPNDEYEGTVNTAIEYDSWFWEKIVVNGNSVSVWAYADGDEPSLNANHTFTTDNVSNPVASLIFIAGTDDDSSAVIIDEFYYNLTPGDSATPTVANAGSDQTVDVGSLVTLNGSNSSGNYLSYDWTQLSGTTVTLSGPTSSVTTFSAPSTVGELSFELTVINSVNNESDSDTVNVTVINTTEYCIFTSD